MYGNKHCIPPCEPSVPLVGAGSVNHRVTDDQSVWEGPMTELGQWGMCKWRLVEGASVYCILTSGLTTKGTAF
jgi:hypothetical protein